MKLLLALLFTTLAVQASAPTYTTDELDAIAYDACADQYEAVACE